MIKVYIIHSFTKNLLLLLGILIAGNFVIAQTHTEQDIVDTSKDGNQLKEPGAVIQIPKATSTAAVSTVSGDVLYKTPAANLSNTLYGLLSGLTVLQGSGEPGYDAADLRIRGLGTYNNLDYTIYVDGFQTTFSYFQYLSPGEIESISILKDAAALAPFGMKGANGVLWVTTKRGHVGKPKVQLMARTGFQQPVNINYPLSSYNYARLYNEAISNDNGRTWSPEYSETQLQAYKNGTGTDVNWYDEVLKKYSRFTTTDATFSGGDTIARYFVVLGYMNNQGLYDVTTDDTHSNANLQLYTIRGNLNFNMFKIFEGNIDIGGRAEDRKYPYYNTDSLWANLAAYPSNIYPVKNENGTWTGSTNFPDNPLASITALGYTSIHDRTLQANFNLKEKLDFITKGLYLCEGVSFNTWTRGTYNKTKNYARYIDSIPQTTDKNTNYSIYDDNGTNQWYWKQFQGLIGYHRQFSRHDLSAAVNYLQYTYTVDENQNGVAGINTNYGYQNIGGKIHYVFNNRYAAGFGFAYSGSDNYAKGNRWGFYPALSAAWIISQGSFLKESKYFNFLKLRASVGKSGFDNFLNGRYLYQLYYANSGIFATGNGNPTWHNGLSQAYTPNPDIFAEQSLKYNIGLDGKLFRKLDVTFDVFIDKRSGIVTQDNSLLAVFGTTPPYRNIGEVTNKGFEASLGFNNNIGKLRYDLSGIASFNSNKIDYMAEVPPVSSKAAKTGNPIGSFFGYVADGFYDITDFNADGSLGTGLPVPGFGAVQPGDVKYIDQNNDNKIDQADLVKVGNTYFPNFTYAFTIAAYYAGFNLRILLQGDAGRTVNLLDARLQTIAFVNNGNAYTIAEGRWAYYPDQGIDTRATAAYPRLSTIANNNNYINSTFWLKNGDFLRLRNVEIGYTIPASLLNKTGISNVRIFVTGINLLTFSSLLKNYNMDPETVTGYPALKSYNMGITVDF